MNNPFSRRDFVKAAAVTAATLPSFNILRAQTAPGIRPGTVKVGLIGCGGRGNGALGNFKQACELLGLETEVVAIADAFQDRVDGVGKKHGVDAARRHSGYDAYHKVVESDAEFVLMATPPNFRPVHFDACVEAGKHCFIEKPVAVDPPGARAVIASGEKARAKGLSVVAGTQRRYDRKYRETKARIEAGAVGSIVGGVVSWVARVPWVAPRREGQSDTEYMTRNWLNFTELSGDHIVEQHVHQLDVTNWYMGRNPVAFVGMGGRARRETGNQFDFFSVDIDYGDGVHIHSQCRQVPGCYNRVGETFRGTEGSITGTKVKGRDVALAAVVQENASGMIQEHVELIKGARGDTPINAARDVADATLVGIGGRISAYTGQLVRWIDMTEREDSPLYSLKLAPTALDFENGTVVLPEEVPPVPGAPDEVRTR